MPAKEFSFEQDIAPHASNFFREIGRDRNLTTSARQQLQGELLGGVMDIESQRLKLQGERDRGRINKLRIAEGVGAMEDARARRIREENSRSDALSLKNQLQELNASDLTDEEKRDQLTGLEINHSGNPDSSVGRLLGTYRSSLPRREAFTATQKAEFAARGVSAETIATGDPMAIGQEVRAVAEDTAGRDRFLRDAQKKEDARTKDIREARKHLLTGEMEMAPVVIRKEGQASYVDEDSEPIWMTDESTVFAAEVVKNLGTEEEKAQFKKLRNSPNDFARMNLIHRIQNRGLSGSVYGDRTAEKARSIFDGDGE